MYNINDTVVYGIHGVCKIVDIEEKDFGWKKNSYYVLKPVFDDKSTIYLGTDSDNARDKLHLALSAEEIYSLVKLMPDEKTIWIEDDKTRKEQFRAILAGEDREALVRLLKTLHHQQQKKKETGKKLSVEDDRIMKDAEKKLHEEFAHVLNIELDEVGPFILEQTQVSEKK